MLRNRAKDAFGAGKLYNRFAYETRHMTAIK